MLRTPALGARFRCVQTFAALHDEWTQREHYERSGCVRMVITLILDPNAEVIEPLFEGTSTNEFTVAEGATVTFNPTF